jgi:dienelactone hydrolase
MNSTVTFLSDNLKLKGLLVQPDGNGLFPAVLYLHGGGQNIGNRFTPWQQYLADRGIMSLFFSFRGCGSSDGKFEDGSLTNRLRDGTAAYQFLQSNKNINPKNIAVVGASMGAHVACRLTEKITDVKALLLLSAAAYGKGVEEKPLNQSFTDEVRKPKSWHGSPAFSALGKFSGTTLVVYGSEDRVIPDEVKRAYRQLAKNGYREIAGAPHTVLVPNTATEQQCRQELFRISYDFFSRAFDESSSG